MTMEEDDGGPQIPKRHNLFSLNNIITGDFSGTHTPEESYSGAVRLSFIHSSSSAETPDGP